MISSLNLHSGRANAHTCLKAVYEGERQFSAIAVASDSENFTAPCGVCRQVLAEFCDAEMPVICINREGKYRILSLGELLPLAFSKKDME